jgi:hypothetical protein
MNLDFEGTAQGSWRDYFQSQIKVAAMIRKGVSFSRTRDKFLGSELYFLYMFI